MLKVYKVGYVKEVVIPSIEILINVDYKQAQRLLESLDKVDDEVVKRLAAQIRDVMKEFNNVEKKMKL